MSGSYDKWALDACSESGGTFFPDEGHRAAYMSGYLQAKSDTTDKVIEGLLALTAEVLDAGTTIAEAQDATQAMIREREDDPTGWDVPARQYPSL